MPFTPLHFGPALLISLPLSRYIDIPCFLLANVAIDVEPLCVMLFKLNYPVHGYFHTFIFAIIIGALLGLLLYPLRNLTGKILNRYKVEYKTGLLKIILSGSAGAFFHILMDSPLYYDIKPFYPLNENPFLGIYSTKTISLICMISFAPAGMIYIWKALKFKKESVK